VRKADNLTPCWAVFMKSGNLNFLEPSGPIQACNGTAFFYIWLATCDRNTIATCVNQSDMQNKALNKVPNTDSTLAFAFGKRWQKYCSRYWCTSSNHMHLTLGCKSFQSISWNFSLDRQFEVINYLVNSNVAIEIIWLVNLERLVFLYL